MKQLSEAHKGAWRMLLTARARLVEKMENELTNAGVVSFDWYDILLWLEEAGGRLKMGELADRVLVSRSGLTRMVDRLEAAGYLRREHCAEDRRAVYAVMTDAGLEAREAAWRIYEPAIVEHFARFLSEREATEVRDVLARTMDAPLK